MDWLLRLPLPQIIVTRGRAYRPKPVASVNEV
jgi:hypothetical protein